MVHNVTSMLCYTLIIAFLFGTWAAAKSEDNVLKTPLGKGQNQLTPKKAKYTVDGSLENITVDPKLFQKWQFQSPRVLFSTQPPPSSNGGRTDSLSKNTRAKRDTHPVHKRPMYAVCDNIDFWNYNITTAIDIKGEEVNVLDSIIVNNQKFKQYFYETKCREDKSKYSGCRGINANYWNSYCVTRKSFVRALTSKDNKISRRFIRINTACVCVITRKNGAAPVSEPEDEDELMAADDPSIIQLPNDED